MHNRKTKKKEEPQEAKPQYCKKCLRRLSFIELKGGKVEKWCVHCDGPGLAGGYK